MGWTATNLDLIKFKTTIISEIAKSSSLAHLYFLTNFSHFLYEGFSHLEELKSSNLKQDFEEVESHDVELESQVESVLVVLLVELSEYVSSTEQVEEGDEHEDDEDDEHEDDEDDEHEDDEDDEDDEHEDDEDDEHDEGDEHDDDGVHEDEDELLEVLLQLSLQEEPALIPVTEINEQESLLSQL